LSVSNKDEIALNNFLTFDIEEWYDGEFTRNKVSDADRLISGIEAQINILIELCAKYYVKSTCFVTGQLAHKKPDLVRRLFDNGHEIASHSYSHNMVSNMTRIEFEEDLNRSIEALSDAVGVSIKGFRAPSWSVNEEILPWYYDVLSKAGVEYSSSIYPGKTSLFGIPNANPDVHFIEQFGILEIPQQLAKIGATKIGFAGGAFFRLFPRLAIEYLMAQKNHKGKPVFVYIHPWELQSTRYPIKLSFSEYMIMNWGISWNVSKLAYILNKFGPTFMRMGDFTRTYQATACLD